MIQEEEDLLKKVLYEMLPYDELYVKWSDGEIENIAKRRHCLPTAVITNSMMFLRPMSSMTNDERFEYLDFLKVEIQDGGWVSENYVVSLADMPMLIDWLNAHHFDYKGLIKKGLAIEAPEGMYNN